MSEGRTTEALLLVDLFTDFEHEDGDALLRSFTAAHPHLVRALEAARSDGLPVVFANDARGRWHGDRDRIIGDALAGRGGKLLGDVVPGPEEPFVVKPKYSAFDLTPLTLILRSLGVERVLLAGTATEMCVTQTAIAAREREFQVTVLEQACAAIDGEATATALTYLTRVVGVRVH